MLKNALVSATTAALLLVMLTACSDDEQSQRSADKVATSNAGASANAAGEAKSKRAVRPQRETPKKAPPPKLEAFQSAAVMSQPVDFSTPENVASTMTAIEEGAGEQASSRVESAIGYLLVYDLSVSRNKQKLYEKLNGKTPNDIIAMTGR